MCHFITAALPGDVEPQKLKPVVRPYGMRLEALENAFVQSQLQAGERYYLTTAGYCDCGTGLGAQIRAARRRERNPEDELPKLRRKGWSQAKIDRWLAEKREAAERSRTSAQTRAVHYVEDAEHWSNCLRELLASGETPYIGLLLHWYRVGLDAERIQIQEKVRVPAAEITVELLLHVEEDVLYRFTRS